MGNYSYVNSDRPYLSFIPKVDLYYGWIVLNSDFVNWERVGKFVIESGKLFH